MTNEEMYKAVNELADMIIEYAKRLKCEKKIRMIMEVFI